MSSKQTSSETTIQADVAPGDETGIYYITICNLPFGSSWQELKDWLRQACVVDHIELFRTSTSGWIRLRGKDDFEKAWKHINSVDFRGRYIIASDRNRTEPIKIKELIESSSHSKNDRWPPMARFPYCQMVTAAVPTTTTSARATAPYEAQLGPVQYSGAYQGQMYAMHGYPLQPMLAVSPPYDARLDPWRTTATYSPTHDLTYVDLAGQSPYVGLPYPGAPYRMGHAAAVHAHPSPAACESMAPSDWVRTEPLKILVTSISQRASPDETMAWLRRKTGPYADDIIHVDVPSQSAKNRVRGHAFVMFRSTAAAHGAVQLLDQALFQSRKISARFTMEGVTEGERTSSVALGEDEARGADKDGGDEKHEKHEGGRDQSKEDIPARPSKSQYVIVDGSSRRLHKK